MPTTTNGGYTATFSFATVPQVAYYDRHVLTIEMLRMELFDLLARRGREEISITEYEAKATCIRDLAAQAITLWDSQKPAVVWS